MGRGSYRSPAPSTPISTLSSDANFARILRRLKPEKHHRQLIARNVAELPFLEQHGQPLPLLVLDTTVYIDDLQGNLTEKTKSLIRTAALWHSAVTEAELLSLIGLLNPTHPDTAHVVRQVTASVELRSEHRTLTPDREVWREAGVLAGLLGRLQHYGKADQRRTFNDALILLSAARQGCTVLTRNVADFDLLQQLAPHGKVLFYQKRER